MESLSMQLTPLFDWLLRTTLQAALLSCLILIVQLVLRGRLPIRWHYCLWLLLLVRMATPWLPESKISVFNWVPPVNPAWRDHKVPLATSRHPRHGLLYACRRHRHPGGRY